MYFMAQFWRFKIFLLPKGNCLGDLLTHPHLRSILLLFSFSISVYTNSSAMVKYRHFNTQSPRADKFLIFFLIVLVLKVIIFSTARFIVWWSLHRLCEIANVDIPWFNKFIEFCFSNCYIISMVSTYIIEKNIGIQKP